MKTEILITTKGEKYEAKTDFHFIDYKCALEIYSSLKKNYEKRKDFMGKIYLMEINHKINILKNKK
jgi:hypothetical protein